MEPSKQYFNVTLRTYQIIDKLWFVEVDPSITMQEAKQRIMDDPYAIWSQGFYPTLTDSEVIDTLGVKLGKIEE
jgi:hypothetical protein